MKRPRYIPQPHPYQQRQRWTGFCVACGLPTEHDVHNYVLLNIKTAPAAPQPEEIEPEEMEPAPRYSPQLQLF